MKEQKPEELKEAIICPLHKKGNKTEYHNHKGIVLLNTVYEIYTLYMKQNLKTQMEKNYW